MMFDHTTATKDADGDTRQPLLDRSQEDLDDAERVVFAIDDNEDRENDDVVSPNGDPLERNVRFQEGVHVIEPVPRWTIQSREAGAFFSLQSDPSSSISQNLTLIRMTSTIRLSPTSRTLISPVDMMINPCHSLWVSWILPLHGEAWIFLFLSNKRMTTGLREETSIWKSWLPNV
jgi:hypothetical protein